MALRAKITFRTAVLYKAIAASVLTLTACTKTPFPTANLPTFTVGGNVSGLSGTVTLANNGANGLTVSANGAFTFAPAVQTGSTYNVAVTAQPNGQTCTVTNGAGTIGSSNVTNVAVACAGATFSIGGTVTGLSGTVVLANPGSANLSVTANGSFTIANNVNNGTAYAVTVLTQPNGQTCSVTNGNGTVPAANITNIAVNCVTNTFTVGGTVSGLVGAVVLANNGTNNLTVNANGNFSFTTSLTSGAAYAVTVVTNPPNQLCSVSNGSGTVAASNVTNVNITCVTPTFAVGGTVSGLGSGKSVTLANNGSNALTITANGTFTFSTPINSGGAYAVTVATQPVGQQCTVANGSGTISANVSNVSVSCVTLSFTIGGSVSGLGAGKTLVLANNGTNNLTISGDGAFVFSTAVLSGNAYAVTVIAQPVNQTCTVSNGSGSVTSANVTNVSVSCITTAFNVGGTVTGLAGTLVLANNGANNLSLTTSGAFTFTSAVNNGSAYAVTVVTQPAGQLCTVTNGTGTISGADVSNVAINCIGFSVSRTNLGALGLSSDLHFCALRTAGSVACWGRDNNRQLGDNNTSDAASPVSAAGVASATWVGAGPAGSCAVADAQGRVYCWGLFFGFGVSLNLTTPTQITDFSSGVALTGARAVAAGRSFACGVLAAAQNVVCWGDNQSSQLGISLTNGSAAARQVTYAGSASGLLDDVSHVVSAEAHTCALRNNGDVLCWGGDPTPNGSVFVTGSAQTLTTPTLIMGGVQNIATSASRTCVVVAGDTVKCWGDNASGSLGTGSPTPTNVTSPTAIPGLSNVAQIAVSSGLICAVKKDNTLWCWGGDNASVVTAPTQVAGVTNAIAVSVQGLNGSTSACILRSDHTVSCWGRNGNGQLGNGTFADSLGGPVTSVVGGAVYGP